MEEKIWSLEEVRLLLPWLNEATRTAEAKLLEVQKHETDRNLAIAAVGQIVHHWAETVYKLGGLPKQPFTVDFNSGSDFFCWEYPETDLLYRHDYDAGYAGRHRIEEHR